MKKIITAKHFFLYKTVSNETFSQLSGLENEYPYLTSARIVLHHQKGTFSGEMVVNGPRIHFISKAQGRDLLLVIDDLIQKAEIQIRKHKEKRRYIRMKNKRSLENVFNR